MTNGDNPQVTIISWGLGVCSTAMAVMSLLGDLPSVDAIMNCDPGWELPATYEARDFYSVWLRNRGATVICRTTANIRNHAVSPHCHVPFWTEKGGPLTRECTARYKVQPGKRIARSLAGFDERRPPHPPAGAIEMWIGFTLDEWHRIKQARQKYLRLEHPLVRRKLTRADCVRYLEEHSLPVPPRSACVCCPFRKASEWLEIRNTMPDVWTDACAFDRSIRSRAQTLKGSTARKLYLFRGPGQLPEPLETAPLEEYATRERTLEWFQLPLLCGDGGCWT